MLSAQGMEYGLAAAVAWGALLFARKRLFPDLPSTVFMAGSFYAAVLLYLPIAGAMDPGGFTPPALEPAQFAVVAGTLFGLAAGLLLVFTAIDLGEVSYVSPISKVTPAFVLPLEVLLFDERFSAVAIVGIALVTVAVYFVSFDGTNVVQPFRKLRASQPARLALGSALIIAFVNLGQRSVLQGVELNPTLWVGLKLLGIPLVMTPFAGHQLLELSRVDLWQLLAVGALVAVAEYLVSLAFTTLPASVATPLVGLQAIVAVLLGNVLLDEGHGVVRSVAAVMAIVGIALISTA